MKLTFCSSGVISFVVLGAVSVGVQGFVPKTFVYTRGISKTLINANAPDEEKSKVPPEVFMGVKLPFDEEKVYELLEKNVFDGDSVDKIGKKFQGHLQSQIGPTLKAGTPKAEGSLQFLKDALLEFNDLQRSVPSGSYKFFGNENNRANELALLLKTNPFMASSLTKADDGGFELKSFDDGDNDPSLYLKYVRNLNGAGHRVNFKFTSKMEVESCTMFDDVLGKEVETVSKDDEKKLNSYAGSAIYNLIYYASCQHGTIHVLHQLLTSVLLIASEDYETMNKWAKTYNENIYQKYAQVEQALINAASPFALITGPLGFGSSAIMRFVLKDLLDTWGKNPTAEGFFNEMMKIDKETMKQAGILDEFMKHFDLIEDFATATSGALRDIDAKKFAVAEAKLTSLLDDCGKFKSEIDSLQKWIELMTVTGIVHGSTLSYSRYVACEDVLKWRNFGNPVWDRFDLTLGMLGLATITGMGEGKHVMTSTSPVMEGVDPTFMKVLNDHNMKASNMKVDYRSEIQKRDDFDEMGFIVSTKSSCLFHLICNKVIESKQNLFYHVLLLLLF